MNKTLITNLATLALMLMPAAAHAMLPRMAVPAQATAATTEPRTIVSEDFAAFAAGSEDEPDASNIANLQTGDIADGFFHQPGWTGAAIHQAGGACAILTGKYSDGQGGMYEDTGFLRTPNGNYSGLLTIKFRARLADATATTDQLAVILNSTQGRLEYEIVEVTPQWADYSISFTKGLFSGNLIEFTMRELGVILDDVNITAITNSLKAPVVLEATDFYNGGFTAHWEPVADATKYTVSVFEKDIEGASHLIDFEDINVTSSGKYLAAEPNLPEGWTFTVANGAAPEVSLTEGADGTTGIIFDATDDGFVTPTFDTDIVDFAFFGRSLYGKPCFSRLEFSVLVNGAWAGLGNIDIERIAATGEDIHLSSKLPAGVRAIKMRYFKNAANDGGKDIQVLVDNIRIMTDPASVATVAEVTAEGTSARIEGLNPEADYAYSVVAANDQFGSAPSAEMMATGLEAPALLSHEDLTDEAYTACWLPSPKAHGYFVNNYKVFTPKADTDVTVLYEDFSKVTQGTLTAPVGLYNVYNQRSLDEYTTMPGWIGLCNYLVNGMMGTRSYFTVKGAIQTPSLDLAANDGKFTVEITIVADTDAANDQIVVQAGPEKFQYIPVEKVAEPFTATLTFDNGDAQTALLIYSYQGSPFYIDDIRVSQHYAAGQQQFTLVSTHQIEGHDNCRQVVVNTADADNDEENMAYRVFAFRHFYGDTRYSASYDVQHVSNSSAVRDIFEEIDAAAEAPAEYFDAMGRRIDSPAPGQLVIERRGTKATKHISR